MPNRRALCIGIDDYPGPESLNGCVNDAHAWSTLLQDVFGFTAGDVRLLVNKAATRNNTLSAIQSLFSGLSHGDVVVLTVSCHGSYSIDTSSPGFKEVLCPYDSETAWIELAEVAHLTHSVPSGVKLTLLLDTGFLGTVTRAAISESLPGPRTPDDRRLRFLSPALMGKRLLENPWRAGAGKTDWNGLVLMACSDREYAYEAFIVGEHRGAFSYAAIEAIRTAGGKLTASQLEARVTYLLDEHGFPQHPQLLGKRPKGRDMLFG